MKCPRKDCHEKANIDPTFGVLPCEPGTGGLKLDTRRSFTLLADSIECRSRETIIWRIYCNLLMVIRLITSFLRGILTWLKTTALKRNLPRSSYRVFSGLTWADTKVKWGVTYV